MLSAKFFGTQELLQNHQDQFVSTHMVVDSVTRVVTSPFQICLRRRLLFSYLYTHENDFVRLNRLDDLLLVARCMGYFLPGTWAGLGLGSGWASTSSHRLRAVPAEVW